MKTIIPFALVVLLCSAGCSSTRDWRSARGANGDGALLKSRVLTSDARRDHLYFTALDSQPIERGAMAGLAHISLRIDTGKHRASFEIHRTTGVFTTEAGMRGDGAAVFEAKEDRTYILNVADSLEGVRAWIEDEESHEAVSSVQIVELRRIHDDSGTPVYIPIPIK